MTQDDFYRAAAVAMVELAAEAAEEGGLGDGGFAAVQAVLDLAEEPQGEEGFAEWQAFCMEGVNRGKPGPCPEPKSGPSGGGSGASPQAPETPAVRKAKKAPPAHFKPAQAKLFGGAHAALEQAQESGGLDAHTAAVFSHAVTRVTGKLPEKVASRVTEQVSSWSFAADSTAAANVWVQDGGARGAGAGVAGFYNRNTGRLVADGGAYGAKREGALGLEGSTRAGVLAHEMFHALDRGAFVSVDSAWRKIWKEELGGGRLSDYASTHPDEGAAEFARALWGSDVPLETVKAHFPRAYAYFQERGWA
jgi:hypothetical protein